MPKKTQGKSVRPADSATKVAKKPKATADRTPSAPMKRAVASRVSLTEGAKAPSFRLLRDGGQQVSLADYSGRKLAIFFYPRADTPGCTKEAMDFSHRSDAFAKANTTVLGISADPLKAQEGFRDKYRLSVPLASDESQAVLNAYGVWGEKSMYGRTFMGIVRTTVLIDTEGKIAKIWRNVRVDGHADEVLTAAQQL
jgi:peroxiredoxin Q/BCP